MLEKWFRSLSVCCTCLICSWPYCSSNKKSNDKILADWVEAQIILSFTTQLLFFSTVFTIIRTTLLTGIFDAGNYLTMESHQKGMAGNFIIESLNPYFLDPVTSIITLSQNTQSLCTHSWYAIVQISQEFESNMPDNIELRSSRPSFPPKINYRGGRFFISML